MHRKATPMEAPMAILAVWERREESSFGLVAGFAASELGLLMMGPGGGSGSPVILEPSAVSVLNAVVVSGLGVDVVLSVVVGL